MVPVLWLQNSSLKTLQLFSCSRSKLFSSTADFPRLFTSLPILNHCTAHGLLARAQNLLSRTGSLNSLLNSEGSELTIGWCLGYVAWEQTAEKTLPRKRSQRNTHCCVSSRYQGTCSSFVDPSGLQRALHNIINLTSWSSCYHSFFILRTFWDQNSNPMTEGFPWFSSFIPSKCWDCTQKLALTNNHATILQFEFGGTWLHTIIFDMEAERNVPCCLQILRNSWHAILQS
jgi:hypothetical protein